MHAAVPSLLLLVNDVGLEYAEITESALANGLTYQQLLGTGQAGTRIKGLYQLSLDHSMLICICP